MDEIAKPELLDPDRVDRDDREHFTAEDHRSQTRLLAKALGESCAYAEQLWEQVDALRAYLLTSLPPDPRVAPLVTGQPAAMSASPTGPDDEQGWQRWVEAYASTTSVLCGAHGDSGFGLSRARDEARARRSPPGAYASSDRPPAAELPSAQLNSAEQTDVERAQPAVAGRSAMKAAGGAVIAVLALRGLRTLPGLRALRRP